MIERISLAFTKRILRITPQVARRTGWNKHGHNQAFYIKFRTEEGRDEVSVCNIKSLAHNIHTCSSCNKSIPYTGLE